MTLLCVRGSLVDGLDGLDVVDGCDGIPGFGSWRGPIVSSASMALMR